MTVELAVLTPVVIVTALVIISIFEYMTCVARFDSFAGDVLVQYGSANSGYGEAQIAAQQAQQRLQSMFSDNPRVQVRVEARKDESSGWGEELLSVVAPRMRMTAFLTYTPWPFEAKMAYMHYHAPIRVEHRTSIVVDPYQTGLAI